MEIILLPPAVKDLAHWKKTGNKSIQNKISKLLKSIKESPFEGIGKPEALKHELSGKWSRRITQEHRIVYEVEGTNIYIFSLKGHYY